MAMSRCKANASFVGRSKTLLHRLRPPGASTSWALTRMALGRRRTEPVRTSVAPSFCDACSGVALSPLSEKLEAPGAYLHALHARELGDQFIGHAFGKVGFGVAQT